MQEEQKAGKELGVLQQGGGKAAAVAKSRSLPPAWRSKDQYKETGDKTSAVTGEHISNTVLWLYLQWIFLLIPRSDECS